MAGTKTIHDLAVILTALILVTDQQRNRRARGPALKYPRQDFHDIGFAALGNVAGRAVQLGYTLPGVYAPYEVGSIFTCGWLSPVPRRSAWIDNYMSLVGVYHPDAVNVWLAKSQNYGDTSDPIKFLTSVHGYAPRWYGYTVTTPLQSSLGNRYSYERLGSAAQFPSPSPFPTGSLFSQDILSASEMDLLWLQSQESIAIDFLAGVLAFNLGRFGLQSTVNFAAGVAQKAGTVALNVAESFIPSTPTGTPFFTGTAGSTPAYYTESSVQQVPGWSFQIFFQTTPPLLSARSKGGVSSAGGDDGMTNEVPRIWIPVTVPTNAVLFSFDFSFNGDPGEDLLSANIGQTNVFALETKFMPTNTILNSGPIDVSQWAGQTVEFFFGVLGGTSTNANVTLSGMRFYEMEAPPLLAESFGNQIVISWPATITGFTLESAESLTANQWIAVTNTATLVGMRNVLTNSVSGGAKFYRLRK